MCVGGEGIGKTSGWRRFAVWTRFHVSLISSRFIFIEVFSRGPRGESGRRASNPETPCAPLPPFTPTPLEAGLADSQVACPKTLTPP